MAHCHAAHKEAVGKTGFSVFETAIRGTYRNIDAETWSKTYPVVSIL